MHNVWLKYNESEKNVVNDFCNDYKNFLSECKTERECIVETIKMAKQNGFRDIREVQEKKEKLKPGDKIYAVNMGKALILFVVGQNQISLGMNIVGSHIDSPRLDLKCSPVYENNELCLLDTHYYGEIKKYQWVTLPLAIHGVVVKKDGTKIILRIGENENDLVVGITDLLPHLEKDKKEKIEISGEDLNVLVGSVPLEKEEKDAVKKNIFKILEGYNISEDDFFSAEIEIVPAGKARDFGLDRSMIMGYGQDDRVCAYTSIKAILETNNPKSACMCILVDKEEIGSVGATAMNSKFFENIIAEIMNLCDEYNELNLRHAFNNSQMLSSDVTAAFDPNYPTPMNEATDAHFAHGISFNKYTGSRGKYDANDANPEFIGKLRKILDENNVNYQATEMGKVDAGGGGTIAYIMASYGMNVIDAGVPLLNMHAPWEISCKVDIYESYKCYKTFFKM